MTQSHVFQIQKQSVIKKPSVSKFAFAAVSVFWIFFYGGVCDTLAAQQTVRDSLQDRLKKQPVSELAARVVADGDAARGAMLYYTPELTCARCHEASDAGQRLGPEIATTNVEATVEHLIESLLLPSLHITEGFQTETIITVDGQQVTGLVVEEDKSTDGFVTLADPKLDGKQTRIDKSDMDERRVDKVSAMPDGLAGGLASEQSFLDLVRYLVEIKKGGNQAVMRLRPHESFFAIEPLPEYEANIDHAGLIHALDDDSLHRGAAIYQRFCARCHGTLQQEGSMPSARRFSDSLFKNGNDPYSMYRTLTHGYGLMVPQRWMVPQQKYDVIHYIREHYVRSSNSDQYSLIDDHYLAGLPDGNEVGPDPVEQSPWSDMDYGNFLVNTLEVGNDGTNIAYKGIAIRLDEGPGGVSQGRRWILYEHDTMRVAAAWSGNEFIDYNGIHFNDQHQVHPRIVGDIHFANDHRPGWANPATNSFDNDPRVVGRDGKLYGPLPNDWLQYRGLFQFDDQVVLQYQVGDSEILESPSLDFVDDQTFFTRTINVEARDRPLLVKVASVAGLVQSSDSPRENHAEWVQIGRGQSNEPANLYAHVKGIRDPQWKVVDESLCLQIPAGPEPLAFAISTSSNARRATANSDSGLSPSSGPVPTGDVADLKSLTRGGPPRYPDILNSNIETRPTRETDPFAVDFLKLPKDPWDCRKRLTGLDFVDDDTAVVCSWDGSVWEVGGLLSGKQLSWRRIAHGLFQPLGIRVVNDQIYVACRDQIVALEDLNNDGFIDYYRAFNSDHQVTEHFHEFAMGLQSDNEGNFYYAKSARHALPALVPHHGTLLKVSSDGSETEIVANGFRAANGVCLNDDGTFFVTDQEGHWNPKNRINWVEPGGFYGNMFGYHNVTDESDDAMQQPLCWITNAFDRSPGELLWVPKDTWGPLAASLLNLSYGMGQVFVVPYEKVQFRDATQWQGGMCSLPIPLFPTGVMRGRFHSDGHLYCCGMYAWAGNQQEPGGLYRIRYTGQPAFLPKVVSTSRDKISIEFSDELDQASLVQIDRYAISGWHIHRTAEYGSPHLDEHQLEVTAASPGENSRTVELTVPGLSPVRCMEIRCLIKTSNGSDVTRVIHNTIHAIGNRDE